METSPVISCNRIRLSFIALIVPIILSCSGCVSVLRYDGPYEGRVIDTQTNQPIEGAVVHGTWMKVYPNPAGSSSEYYDSYEVLTNKDGEFKIPGKGLLILSNIDDMTLSIFKAGYTQFPRNSNWSGLVQFGPFEKVSWDEYGKGTFKLRKMMTEERKNRSVTLSFGPNNKQKLLIRESNKENIEIGRPASTLAPEE